MTLDELKKLSRILCSQGNRSFLRNYRIKFQGALMDIGTQRSVMGIQQAKAYCQAAGFSFNRSPSNQIFRFGAGQARSIGRIPLLIPTPTGNNISLWIDVVKLNTPLLLGLDVMDRQLYKNSLCKC